MILCRETRLEICVGATLYEVKASSAVFAFSREIVFPRVSYFSMSELFVSLERSDRIVMMARPY